jgi:hypothetical protein
MGIGRWLTKRDMGHKKGADKAGKRDGVFVVLGL